MKILNDVPSRLSCNECQVDKSPERIRRMFDTIAPRYDFLNHFLSLGIDKRWRRFTARKILNDGFSGGEILDVCCGTGDLTLALFRQAEKLTAEPKKFYGADFSEAMVERAKQKTAKLSGVTMSVGDALHLPFEENRFAVVANAFGLRNVGDTQGGIAEMVRVCKPGGTVAVLDFSMPALPVLRTLYRFYFTSVLPQIGEWFAKNKDVAYRYLPDSVLAFDSPKQLAERMTELGITDIHTNTLSLGIAALIFGKKENGRENG